MSLFGYLAIDKPAGWTSRDVVNRVQGLVRPVKVGHTGTLDPLATGVLLVALGPATRLVEFSHAASKTYRGTFILGKSSDTLDVEGEVVDFPTSQTPSLQQLTEELGNWMGEISQIPPKYSAINIQGKRAYDLARSGKDFEIPARKVTIHGLELLDYQYPEFSLQIECSTGTYIRTLGSDIARSLGSDAVMSELQRTSVGANELDTCCALESLSAASDVQASLLSATGLLAGMPVFSATEEVVQKIRNGIPVSCAEITAPDPTMASAHNSSIASGREPSGPTSDLANPPSQLAIVDSEANLVAILNLQSNATYRSLRVFQRASEMHQPKSVKAPHNPES